jgi:hypothetical protein
MLQENETRKNILYYATLFVIIAVSYTFYASANYPLLSSDDALNVLMAHYYEFPEDLYCWGQDRGGTVIPFFSQVFIHGFGMPAIDAVSVSNYLILALGFIGFSSLLEQRGSRILFALIWFLPFQRFVDLTRFPIGVQYSFIAFAIFLIARISFTGRSYLYWKNHLLLFAVTLVFGLAIWASDLSIICIAILLFSLLVHQYLTQKTLRVRPEILFYGITGGVLMTLFLVYAKSHAAHRTGHFASVNSWNEILRGLTIIRDAFAHVLSFRDKDLLTSIYTWLAPVLLVLLAVLALRKKVKIAPGQRRFFRYLVLDCCGILGVILLSHWVLINRMGRWYFVATYITLAMIVLIALENIDLPARKRRAIRMFAALIIVIGSGSTFYNMKYVTAGTLRPTADLVGEFKQLGEIGIIAEFWNAYRSSCPNPETIKATPHDHSDVRKQFLVDEVFAQPKLYVIRDSWMKRFPDTLRQFGVKLARAGEPFFMGGCHICRYERVLLGRTFRLPELKTDTSLIALEHGKPVVRATMDKESARDKYVISGPYCTLLPGKYTVRYYVKADRFQNDGPFAMLNVTADYAGTELGKKELFPRDAVAGKYRFYSVDLTIKKRVSNVEFLFLNKGSADVILDKIELIER